MEIEFIQKAGDYRLIRYIEKGLQGKVYLAKDPTQKILCAVKISSLFDLDEFRRQKQFLSSFNHANIVNFKDSYEKVQVKIQGQPIKKSNIIILELAQKGQIFQFIKVGRFSEQIARYYITQLLQGLKYLHQKNIAHRDLKLQNLLISKDYTLKIADFGFAKKKNSKQTIFTTQLGTQGYQAPQILKNPPNYDGQKTDMFAVGVILFIFVKGLPPFSQANITDKAYKMIADKKFNKFWQGHEKKLGQGFFSQQFKDLINKFLSYQPNQRPTFQSLKQQPWFFKKMSEKPLHPQEIHKQMEQRYKVILSKNENKKQLQQQFDKFYIEKTKMIDEKDQAKGDRGQQNDQRLKQFKLSCKKYKQIFLNLPVQNSVIIFLVWLEDYLKKCQQKRQIFMENDLYNIKPFKYYSQVQVHNKNILVNLKFEFQTYFQDQQTKKLSQDDIEKTIENLKLRLQIPTISFDFKHIIFTEQQQSEGIQSSVKYVWKNEIKNHIMSAIDCFAAKF